MIFLDVALAALERMIGQVPATTAVENCADYSRLLGEMQTAFATDINDARNTLELELAVAQQHKSDQENDPDVTALRNALNSQRVNADGMLTTPKKNKIKGLGKQTDKLPFMYRLSLGPTAGPDTLTGEQLADDAIAIDDVLDDPDSAIAAIMQLKAYDEVLVRLLAAQKASSISRQPIPTILALYRTEGVLQLPLSADYVAFGVPADSTDAPSLINGGMDVHCSNALGAAAAFETDPATHQVDVDAIRTSARNTWWVQLAGLDRFSAVLRLASVPGLTPAIEPLINALSATNVAATTTPPSVAGVAEQIAAGDRLNALTSQLVVERIPRDTDPTSSAVAADPPPAGAAADDAVRASPDDVVDFVGGILGEGAALFKRLGRLAEYQPGAPASIEFSKPVAYALYNLQTGWWYERLDGRPNQPPPGLLVSAVVAAAKSKQSAYSALRQQIQSDADFRDKIKKLGKRIGGLSAQQTYDEGWPLVGPWLADPAKGATRTRLLCEFIETADATGTWGSWTEPRGNMSRFKQVLEFYESVFP